MAGIGFTLKRLSQQDNIGGMVHAYAVALLAAAGPWLFTIIALAGITNIYTNFFGLEGLINFRVIVIYNFSFSLVLSAPVFMVATRYIADNIHMRDVTNVPSVMLGSMVILYATQLPLIAIFYFFVADLPLNLEIAAMLNLFLLTTVWLLGVFLSALKDYNAVTWAYGIGMMVSIICAQVLKDLYGDVGMLNGFSIGLAVIVFSLAAKVFSEYAYTYNEPFDIKRYFTKYWELAVGGLFYNAAIWVDKWIMWFAPEAETYGNNLRTYPDYDTAMFLAYLSIVPAMAIFVLAVETNFFERYQRFYDNILQHKPLRKILKNQKAIVESIFNSARNFIIVQGTIAFICVVLAPEILEMANISLKQTSIFRMGILGAFFHVLLLFEMIILSYFDDRKPVMWLCIIYFVVNAVVTLMTLDWGFPYYGYGYLMSSIVTFVLTSILLFSYIQKLPYHAFITSNNSIKHI